MVIGGLIFSKYGPFGPTRPPDRTDPTLGRNRHRRQKSRDSSNNESFRTIMIGAGHPSSSRSGRRGLIRE
jgi:hypothetical protein